jgi:hypothetical protein
MYVLQMRRLFTDKDYEVERTWKEKVVAYFKILSQHVKREPGGRGS